MKYRELDACKSVDEFEVGDKIQYYYPMGDGDAHILKVIPPYLHCSNGIYHFKQCRKLEEINPREFWIHEYDDGDKFIYEQIHEPMRQDFKARASH